MDLSIASRRSFVPGSPSFAEQCFDWSIVALGEWGDTSGLGLGVVCCPVDVKPLQCVCKIRAVKSVVNPI